MSQTGRRQLKLPRPHDRQREIEQSPAKRKIICAGRRAGKTTLAARTAIKKAGVKASRILYATPTQDQHSAFWEKCTEWLAEPIRLGAIRKNETMHTLDFPKGGHIRAKTAWNADTLRGDYADLLILDEYAMMDPDAWDKVGAPMLLDNNGDAWFIFTPKRRNHGFHRYQDAMSDTSGRWAAWHFTSHDNPHLSKEALAEITQDMTEEAYRQEILAEFLENQGAVFRNILACLHAPMDAMPDAHKDHWIIAGVDWGKQADFTAISVGCLKCRQELTLDRFNQIDYAFQSQRLLALKDRWHIRYLLAESNAMGDPIIEQLQRSNVPVQGFQTTASSKPPLIENLALVFERAEWQFLNIPVATGELEAYERKVSETTGRSSYSAPEGLHDDTVIARALMCRAAGNAGPAIIEIG